MFGETIGRVSNNLDPYETPTYVASHADRNGLPMLRVSTVHAERYKFMIYSLNCHMNVILFLRCDNFVRHKPM